MLGEKKEIFFDNNCLPTGRQTSSSGSTICLNSIQKYFYGKEESCKEKEEEIN